MPTIKDTGSLSVFAYEERTVKEHITAVGALNIGLGVLGVLIGCVVLAATVGPGLIALGVEGDALPLGILSIVGGFVCLFLVILSAPGIVGGVGLLKRKLWARYVTLVVAALSLFNFPIGTAVGIYSIVILVQDEAVKFLEPEKNL
jgi:hypothetical protein